MTSREKQELLKECDEQIKMCNTMSFISGCDTIAQYKIKKWVNENFVSGSVSIEFTDSNKATITDTSGATMNLAYTQMKGVHEDVPEKQRYTNQIQSVGGRSGTVKKKSGAVWKEYARVSFELCIE